MELVIGVILLVFVAFALFVYHSNKTPISKGVDVTILEPSKPEPNPMKVVSAEPVKAVEIIEFKPEGKAKLAKPKAPNKNKNGAKNKAPSKAAKPATKPAKVATPAAPKAKKQKPV